MPPATSRSSRARAATPPGTPVLLLHGYPQTHAMWHRVARQLGADFTLVMPDLRGYGDSTKPAPAPTPELDHAQHSKRAMADDMVALMRGSATSASPSSATTAAAASRTGSRSIMRSASSASRVIDIVPTLDMYEATDMRFASWYYHWFFLIQPSPLPERMIGGDPSFYLRWTLGGSGATGLGHIEPAALAEYERCFCSRRRDPRHVRGLPRLGLDRPRARPRVARRRRKDRLRDARALGRARRRRPAATIRSRSGARSARPAVAGHACRPVTSFPKSCPTRLARHLHAFLRR